MRKSHVPFLMEVERQEQQRMDERLLQIARCDTIADVKECMKVLLGLYVWFNKILAANIKGTARDSDSVVMMHMFYSKGASFLQLLDGFPFVDEGKEIGRIIEPTVLYSLARDIYEALCAYELVFVLPKTEEQKMIAYNIFYISSMKERANYKHQTEKSRKIALEEAEDIENAKQQIEATVYYQQLPDKDKQFLQAKMNSPHPVYRLLYEEHAVVPVKWEDAYTTFGMAEEMFGNIYAYLSLYAHPTAVAVTRFREMFTDQQNGIERKVSFAGKLVVQMLSVFVIDFCRQHDFAREVYHQSDEMTKCMADFINIIARGPEYAFYLHMEE